MAPRQIAVSIFIVVGCIGAARIAEASTTGESVAIAARIQQEFGVTVVGAGIQTPFGVTREWGEKNLRLLEQGYRTLRRAIANAFGEERAVAFSHNWGRGGRIARIGDNRHDRGEFGFIRSDFLPQINVTADLAQQRFSPELVAQRIAHENAHISDLAQGERPHQTWSETTAAQIFKMCGMKPGYRQSLTDCWRQHPQWFSFQLLGPRGGNHAAVNSREFYAKMVDAWVRENLGLVPRGHYRDQNQTTAAFWAEMERVFIFRAGAQQ